MGDPRTDEEAWWSTQYAVAVTLLGLDIEDRSLLHEPRVRALLRKIEVDGRSASCARAHVSTNDGPAEKWRRLNLGLEPPREVLT
jgi:2-methylcitrate dehydratase PrpD